MNLRAIKYYVIFCLATAQVCVAKRKLFKPVKDRVQVLQDRADCLPNGCFTAFVERKDQPEEHASCVDEASNESVENIIIELANSCSLMRNSSEIFHP